MNCLASSRLRDWRETWVNYKPLAGRGTQPKTAREELEGLTVLAIRLIDPDDSTLHEEGHGCERRRHALPEIVSVLKPPIRSGLGC